MQKKHAAGIILIRVKEQKTRIKLELFGNLLANYSEKILDHFVKKLGLKSGDQFVVTGDKDVVILKSISPPSLDEFDDLIAEARRQAGKAGMKRSDIKTALAKIRRKK
ncbi:MAG: hypothetical protein R6W88_09975 [Desulfobacterales bacterium]